MRAMVLREPAPAESKPLEATNEALVDLEHDRVRGAAVLELSGGAR
jgi:hypothetical protein